MHLDNIAPHALLHVACLYRPLTTLLHPPLALTTPELPAATAAVSSRVMPPVVLVIELQCCQMLCRPARSIAALLPSTSRPSLSPAVTHFVLRALVPGLLTSFSRLAIGFITSLLHRSSRTGLHQSTVRGLSRSISRFHQVQGIHIPFPFLSFPGDSVHDAPAWGCFTFVSSALHRSVLSSSKERR